MRAILACMLLIWAGAAMALPPVQTRAEAVAQDAGKYADQFGVPQAEAVRRLTAQQASVAATDTIAGEFASRLAGIAIEHAPNYRIIVLLTGDKPVASRIASGVPVVFKTGARATRTQAIEALNRHLADFRRAFPGVRGAGYDQRTGAVVLIVSSGDAARIGADAIRARAEEIGGVPVRIVVNDLVEGDMAVEGGGRVEGTSSVTGRRNRCTTGFVVTNGETHAVTTAAHCPDNLTYFDQGGVRYDLPMIGSWGAAYRDVQINGSPDSPEPIFDSDRASGSRRALESWRNAASTRAGDFVCHWGESSGYSCAEVVLTNFAPPGTLCGGPCTPYWVTVAGPECRLGDSGGPVFSGAIAFGIAKGINRRPDGTCDFYYYMSTDYLPPPWRLLVTGDVSPPRAGPRASGR